MCDTHIKHTHTSDTHIIHTHACDTHIKLTHTSDTHITHTHICDPHIKHSQTYYTHFKYTHTSHSMPSKTHIKHTQTSQSQLRSVAIRNDTRHTHSKVQLHVVGGLAKQNGLLESFSLNVDLQRKVLLEIVRAALVHIFFPLKLAIR